MKRPLVLFFLVLVVGLTTGCAYFQTREPEPPPLPSIEETKPPLTKMKGDYFKEYPWPDLPKPKKDGNDIDTRTYTSKEGDTFQSLAENEMGDAKMGPKLGDFNDMSDSSKPPPGTKIVIPNPILGVQSQIEVKKKGEKEFGPPQPFDTELAKGDAYKLRFETNVDGYLYVFRATPKGCEVLYPAAAPKPAPRRSKPGRRAPKPEPVSRETPKVSAHDPVLIPVGAKGFPYDQKRAGDRVFVFLSLRKNSELEDLKDRPKLKVEDVEAVLRTVNEGGIATDGPIKVLRVSDPADLLGFSLNLSG
jgi:hypothetical protein